MAPQTQTHRGIEIRFGYSISDDLFHAHFDLPPAQVRSGFQRSVSTHVSPGTRRGKQHIQASNEGDLLALARSAIDRCMDEQ
jgi:hypothetical protein